MPCKPIKTNMNTDKLNTNPNNPLGRFILWATNVQRNEWRASLTAFLFVFTLMTAYYLLRPARDAMASDWTDAEVSWLWTLNFFISTAIVALYGWVVTRVTLGKLVIGVYVFFASSFGLFYLLVSDAADTKLIDQSFYVWFCLLYTSPSPRDLSTSRMPSSA